MKQKNFFAKIFILAVMTITSAKVNGQELANFSSSFVDIGFGARPLGMGKAYSALVSDASALLWNPAGIAEITAFEGTFSYTKLFNIIPYSFAALAFSPATNHAIGAGVIISGDQLLKEISFISGYGGRFSFRHRRLNVGITLTLHSASFGKNEPANGAVSGDAFGFGIGIGLQYYFSQNIVFAAHVQNLLNKIEWNSSSSSKYEEGLPRRLIFGVADKNSHSMNFELDFQKSLYRELEDKIYLGAERVFLNKIFLRSGVGASFSDDRPLFCTFGFGVSHYLKKRFYFRFDGAYIIHPLENMIRLSMSCRIE